MVGDEVAITVQQWPEYGRLGNPFVNGRRCPRCRRDVIPHDAVSAFDG
jgi:hypothetical protein